MPPSVSSQRQGVSTKTVENMGIQYRELARNIRSLERSTNAQERNTLAIRYKRELSELSALVHPFLVIVFNSNRGIISEAQLRNHYDWIFRNKEETRVKYLDSLEELVQEYREATLDWRVLVQASRDLREEIRRDSEGFRKLFKQIFGE
jgi:hypothetical protein